MRTLVILGLLVGLCAPAGAATRHQSRPHHPERHVIVPSGQYGAAPPGWYSFPGYRPIPPEENRNLDPSNFGGG
jgi:hypothetical protein